MSTISSIARNEIRLLFRRRAYWVVHGLLALPALVLAGMRIILSLRGLQTPSPFLGIGYPLEQMSILPFFLLLISVIAVPAINQHWGKVGEVLWSTPIEPFTHQAGLFTGLWLGMLPGILLQFAAWVLEDLFTPDSLNDLRFLYALGLTLVTVTIALGLCFLLCALLRNTLVVMIAWTAGWVFLFLSTSPLEQFRALQLTWPYNLYFNNLLFSPSLGLGAYAPVIRGMVLWFLGLGIAAAILGMLVSLLIDRRRSVNRALPLVMAVGVSLILGGSGIAAGSQAVRETQIHPSPYLIQQDAWQILIHRMEAEVDSQAAEIHGSSHLTLKSIAKDSMAESIVLRLNPGLQVSRVLDTAGNELAFTQYGDGVTVDLPVQPGESASIELDWGGRLHLPFDAFGQSWVYYGDKGFYWYFSPHSARGLLWDGVGYLLRDGDWYPWPWVTGPHQALEQQMILRTQAPDVLASTSLQNGVFTWEGNLPQALLAFPPSRRTSLGPVAVYTGKFAGSELQVRIQSIAGGANKMLRVLGEPQLRHVIALPYLDQFFASGDLLLIPEGSGHYLSEDMYSLYGNEGDQALVERATLYQVARAWLLARFPAGSSRFEQVSPRGDKISYHLGTPEFTPENWEQEKGRWVQLPEIPDLTETYSPRRQVSLAPSGEHAVVAFWMAMELSSPNVLQEDLQLIQTLHHDTRPGYGLRYQKMWQQIMPTLFETPQARRLLWGLHQWTESVGSEDALKWAVQALREEKSGAVREFLERLSQLSGAEAKESEP